MLGIDTVGAVSLCIMDIIITITRIGYRARVVIRIDCKHDVIGYIIITTRATIDITINIVSGDPNILVLDQFGIVLIGIAVVLIPQPVVQVLFNLDILGLNP